MHIARAYSLVAALALLGGYAQAQQPSPPGPSHIQNPLQGPEGGTVLRLTAEEKHTILENVDLSHGAGSTLGLGALAEGEVPPSNATLLEFDGVVTQKVSKLAGHKYFVAENKVVVIDRSNKIAAVIEDVKRAK